MTKADELAVLDQAIKALGPDSYLGPWLASLAGHIERSLRNDFLPMTMKELQEREATIVNEATAKATAIVAAAQQERDLIITSGSRAAERYKDEIRQQLSQALRAIDR